MAIENGSAFLLKIGDGETPPAYRTVAGLRTTQLSVNGEAVNVTTKDSGGWRAVSYTHLDVYKRQRRDLAAAWGGPAPAARQTEMTIARDRPRRVIVRKP